MKVLQVIKYFTPKRGGDVNVLYNLSKRLIKRGHDVTILTTDVEFDKEYASSLQGAKVIPFKSIANIKSLPISPSMGKWLKEEIIKFDIIHLHSFRSYQNIIIRKYARRHGIPYIIQPHNSTPRIAKKRLKWLFDITFGYKILKDANKIIAVSKEEVEFVKQMGASSKDILLIYNGMDIESFENLTEYGKFRTKYQIDGKLILYLGRIHKQKGIDFAIKGFSEVCKDIDQLTFVIAGHDYGYKAEIERLVKYLKLGNKVRFTGSLNEEDKLTAYMDADLFVHTVIYMGGVGLTPLEAILCNTPVIVTEECGEVIKEANCGYLVNYGDVTDLAQKMKRLLQDHNEGARLVENGKKYIYENLTWDRVITKVEGIYSEILNKGSA